MKSRNISFKKRLIFDLFKEYRKSEISLHELQYLFWECTLRCNLTCIHCGSDCRNGSLVPDMPASDFLKVTERIRDQYDPGKVMVVITGGEPLVRKDLESCGRELAKQGYQWGIVTNGVLLTEARLKSLVEAGLRSVTVSLDGLEASHNWLRNKECFAAAFRSISILARRDELVFDVVTCVNQKNFGELNEICELLISAGVKRWRLFTITPTGRAIDNPILRLTGSQLKALMEFITETRKAGRIALNLECEGFVGNYEMEVRDTIFFCRAGINIASVLADGSISACPNIDRRFSQGNIYYSDFLDTWNSRFNVMRDRDWMKTGICRECRAFKWCSGNGMHLRIQDSGEVLCCNYKILNE